jgi:hypothetical protein
MFEGIYPVGKYFTNLAKYLSHKENYDDRLGFLLLCSLGDIIYSARLALTHYFTKPMDAECLQNSHLGPPYVKWALVNNENYQEFDRYFKILIQVGANLYSGLGQVEPHADAASKQAFGWFYSILDDYKSCHFSFENEKALTLTLSMTNIHLSDFLDDGGLHFKHHSVIGVIRESDIFNVNTVTIQDRIDLHHLQKQALREVEWLEDLQTEFGQWLNSNYQIKDLVKPYQGRFLWL